MSPNSSASSSNWTPPPPAPTNPTEAYALPAGAACFSLTHLDLNLVLWRWGDALPSRVVLIDDEQRLPTSVAEAGQGG